MWDAAAAATPLSYPSAPPTVSIGDSNSGGGGARFFRPIAAPPPPLASTTSSSGRDVWRNPDHPIPAAAAGDSGGRRRSYSLRRQRHNHHHQYLDRSIDMDELLASLSLTTTPEELHSVMSPYLNISAGQHQVSLRFMVSLLSREPDWRRSVALLDWMLDTAGYPPSIFAYNIVLRNALRARQWPLASGLVSEMRRRHALAPDRVTYSTLISSLGQAGLLDAALRWLDRMERDSVSPDLVLFSTLIELARKLGDHAKAAALFRRLRTAGIAPDLVAYNSMLNVLSRAGLLREARKLLDEMLQGDQAVAPNTVSFSTLFAALVDRGRLLEALSLFAEMRARRVPLDLTTCNIMIDAYGQLDMAREADRLFWSLRRLAVAPSVVTYNTMLRVYGDADLIGEAIHLFRLMQRKGIEQNVVTYNTMIKIYGKTLEHEKAGNLVQEMQRLGIQPNAVTYSTIISIWGKAGKLDRAAMLFQKLKSTGVKIDPVLYQTMVVVYERSGLVGHAKRLLHDLKHPEDMDIPKETAITILANAGRVEEATWVFRQAVEAGEMKDISVFRAMMDLFSRNRKHKNVVEVFDRMRATGYFPDSEMIATVLNAHGKLQNYDLAEAVYREMQEEGCVFSDRVHFQMMSLLGARRDFKGVESLLEMLNADPNIDKKELHLVAASIYEKANKLDEASRIIGQISHRTSNLFTMQ